MKQRETEATRKREEGGERGQLGGLVGNGKGRASSGPNGDE